jgi:hypothetical protein
MNLGKLDNFEKYDIYWKWESFTIRVKEPRDGLKEVGNFG